MAAAAAAAVAAQAAIDAQAATDATAAALRAGAPAAVALAARFSLSPAHASNDVINYGTSDGMKLYNKATKPQTNEYDGSSDFLRLFLAVFEDHADESNWGLNVTVPTANGPRELASRYGQITADELRAHVTTFSGTQTRQAQNSSQMLVYLKGSLDDNFKLEVYMNASSYTLAGVESGELFLMEIISLVNADTRATVGYLRESLSMLPAIVAKLNNDIKAINKYINNQVDALNARGESSSDLMTNIFKAYATVQDKDFVRYIDDLKTQYEDGRLNMTADKLMMLGYQKFKNLNLHQTWQAPTQEEKNDIVALSTLSEEMVALKTTIAGLKEQLGTKKKTGGDGGGDKWAWKATAPNANQAKTKQVNNKTYHWCPNHVKWCIHTPAECKGLAKATTESAPPSTVTTTTTASSDASAAKRKLELATAFNTFCEDSDDGNDII
jgi:hypothetical protein